MRRCGSKAPPHLRRLPGTQVRGPGLWLAPTWAACAGKAGSPAFLPLPPPPTPPQPRHPPIPTVKPGSKAPIWALARGWRDCGGRGASWERKLWGWGGGCGKSFEGRRPGMGTPGAGRRPLEPGWAGDERGMSTPLPPPSRMSWREPELQPVSLSRVSPFAV